MAFSIPGKAFVVSHGLLSGPMLFFAYATPIRQYRAFHFCVFRADLELKGTCETICVQTPPRFFQFLPRPLIVVSPTPKLTAIYLVTLFH